jgi:hypothetical protein
MQRVSESVFLQSLSKKVIKTDIMIGSIINGIRLPPKLKLPCAAGIFTHRIEVEFYQVIPFLLHHDLFYLCLLFNCCFHVTGADSSS